MFKENLYSFFSNQVSRFESNILTFEAFDSEEFNHNARVCLKKIKTILTFLEKLKIPGLIVKKVLKKENNLFNVLGNLREINKQYSLIKEYEIKLSLSFHEYLDYLQKKEKKERENLKKTNVNKIINHLKSIQKSVLEIIDMYDDDYLYDESLLFINTEFAKVNSLKKQLTDFKNWHIIRKCLKNNMYLMNIILESHHQSNITKEIYTDIDELQDNIGNWRDNIVSFEMVSSFIKKNKTIKSHKLIDYNKLIRCLP